MVTVTRMSWWVEILSELAKEENGLQYRLTVCGYPWSIKPYSGTKNPRKGITGCLLGHRDLCSGGRMLFCAWLSSVNPNIRQRPLLNLRWYYLISCLSERQGSDTYWPEELHLSTHQSNPSLNSNRSDRTILPFPYPLNINGNWRLQYKCVERQVKLQM